MQPAPLSVSESGSFAEHTIVVRKPQIIANVIAYNRYPDHVVDALNAFRDEIAQAPVGPLTVDAPDTEAWMQQWQRRQGLTWRALDWFFAETYFYRRLIEIVGYLDQGQGASMDPFGPQKREALQQGLAPLATFCEAVADNASPHDALMHWLDRCLWGNQVDLSNVTVRIDHRDALSAGERLLVDHRADVCQMLLQGLPRVDVIADNSGTELLADLALAAQVLKHHHAERVTMHLKARPFFVSDAMIADAQETLAALAGSDQPALAQLGALLQGFVDEGRLALQEHPFWTTWQHFSQMPDDLCENLGQAGLIIVKGDANYRRLLEDRHWPTTASMASLTPYMPAPFVALRTLKSEIVVGLAEGQAHQIAQQDADWLIDGRWGVVHLVH